MSRRLASPFPSSVLSKDTSRTAERTGRCNCGRASLPGWPSGAYSLAQDDGPGSRVARLSASVSGPPDLRADFSPSLLFSSLLFPPLPHIELCCERILGRFDVCCQGLLHFRELPALFCQLAGKGEVAAFAARLV
nr:hypothetical protein K4M19_00417 [Agrobacterium fabrum]